MRLVVVGFVLIGLGSCIILSSGERLSHASKAKVLREQGKYDEAIREYRLHIDSRLNDSRREADENPFFYEVFIGDILLEKGEPELALKSYEDAQRKGVQVELISFRLREVAGYYRKRGDYRRALELLRRYRDLDEFQFDADIDEISKEMVAVEDRNEQRR